MATAIKTNPKANGKAVAGLVLGLVGIVAWFIPLIGFPVTIVGLIMSVLGLKSQKKNMAIAGLVLCIIFLVVTIANAAIGAYIGATSALNATTY